jgi:hypothetical protein
MFHVKHPNLLFNMFHVKHQGLFLCTGEDDFAVSSHLIFGGHR